MAIRVIDTVSGEQFTFPMLPEQLQYSRAGRFQQLKLLSGDVSLPTGESTGRVGFSGKLPGARRSGAYISEWREPGEIQQLWTGWLESKRRLRIVVGGTPVDEFVYLENFKLTFAGGFGDCDYSVSFIRAGSVEYSKSDSSGRQPATYTVQPGDTLWSISLKTTGDGANYAEIYITNRALISSNGRIKPGMVLKIPQVTK